MSIFHVIIMAGATVTGVCVVLSTVQLLIWADNPVRRLPAHIICVCVSSLFCTLLFGSLRNIIGFVAHLVVIVLCPLLFIGRTWNLLHQRIAFVIFLLLALLVCILSIVAVAKGSDISMQKTVEISCLFLMVTVHHVLVSILSLIRIRELSNAFMDMVCLLPADLKAFALKDSNVISKARYPLSTTSTARWMTPYHFQHTEGLRVCLARPSSHTIIILDEEAMDFTQRSTCFRRTYRIAAYDAEEGFSPQDLRFDVTERLLLFTLWVNSQFSLNPAIRFTVSRATIFRQVRLTLLATMKARRRGPLRVAFIEERNVDLGGIVKDFLTEAIADLSSWPEGSVFMRSESSGDLMLSPTIDRHDAYCLGWLLARCLYHHVSLSCQLSSLFISFLLGLTPTFEYIKEFEPGLGNLIAEAECDNNAFLELVRLLPGLKYRKRWYRTIKGFSDNGALHVLREIRPEPILEERFGPGYLKSCRILHRGFVDSLPMPGVYYLDADLVRNVIVGPASINVDDWRENTHTIGFSDAPEVLQWFWELVDESDELASKILRFSCGISTPPPRGFKDLGKSFLPGSDPLPFTLQLCPAGWLPMGHACMNLLKIPRVTSKESLQEVLALATTVQSFELV
ncbi:E3 Ubiquitin-protein ligase [Giardia muris]|uniref:HECT-type E3 ubiquitin transferase n=1 Tax=Giardia muris TaxID=5742 RepID=A0A4Z1T0C2_GIAMU|nr:E3 Ubiquitin-protein ligase [Giardia muris]|eukprot:TNJ27343.1 E3 Ubiquitin-protein ligase [Giardia muris]